jgi:hypothetical protein
MGGERVYRGCEERRGWATQVDLDGVVNAKVVCVLKELRAYRFTRLRFCKLMGSRACLCVNMLWRVDEA